MPLINGNRLSSTQNGDTEDFIRVLPGPKIAWLKIPGTASVSLLVSPINRNDWYSVTDPKASDYTTALNLGPGDYCIPLVSGNYDMKMRVSGFTGTDPVELTVSHS